MSLVYPWIHRVTLVCFATLGLACERVDTWKPMQPVSASGFEMERVPSPEPGKSQLVFSLENDEELAEVELFIGNGEKIPLTDTGFGTYYANNLAINDVATVTIVGSTDHLALINGTVRDRGVSLAGLAIEEDHTTSIPSLYLPKSGEVQGTIVNASGEPLMNALVTLQSTGKVTRTNHLGLWRFGEVSVGVQQFSVVYSGHQKLDLKNVVVKSSTTTNMGVVTLYKEGVQLGAR